MAQANQEFGTAYSAEQVLYRANDSVSYDMHQYCAYAIVKRLANGGVFGVLPTTDPDGYSRKELELIRNELPERGPYCPACRTHIPALLELSDESEKRVRHLIVQGQRMMAIQELRAATGCPLAWAKIWIEHPGGPRDHEWRAGPPCAYCGAKLPSSLARQCLTCGMDWHDPENVHRGGETSAKSSTSDGPPHALDGAYVLAWAIVGRGVRPTGAVRHVVEGKPLGRVDGLAIARYFDGDEPGVYLFRCDEAWRVLTDTLHADLVDAQEQAEKEYEGIGGTWGYRVPPAPPEATGPAE